MKLFISFQILLLILLLGLSCGDETDGIGPYSLDPMTYQDSPPTLTSAGGNVYRFDWSFDMLEGAKVSILERPDLGTVITDAGGRFDFDGVVVGEDLTFVCSHPNFYPTQTATLVPDEQGLDDVSIQVPPNLIAWAMALWLLERLDPEKCQIATTVTMAGGTPFSPGLAGVKVALDAYLFSESGPIYFKIIEIPGWPMIDLPMRWLEETTHDGGAVFINMPPGEYRLMAWQDGETFTDAIVKCRPGMLVNASPPYGLHRID